MHVEIQRNIKSTQHLQFRFSKLFKRRNSVDKAKNFRFAKRKDTIAMSGNKILN
jgi:hypothetical protein